MSVVRSMHLVPDITAADLKLEPTRKGFGRGLLEAGKQNNQVVAVCADLTASTNINLFAEAFPERFIEIGIAEQNLATIGAGLAAMGKIPFVSSYAAFSPGRNWEQIRTTICLNDRAVKIVGSHAGILTSPDGATHQVLEDIALMRSLPNMVVVVPGDSVEAEKATLALVGNKQPSYLRLARGDTPVFTTADTPFELGKAYVLREGTDVTIFGTGIMTYQCLAAAELLAKQGVSAEVVHVPTVKPLDTKTILASAKKTGRVVTAEEGQIAAGFGSAVAEFLSETLPMPVKRIGAEDRYGESGEQEDLLQAFGFTPKQVAQTVADWCQNMPQYHRP